MLRIAKPKDGHRYIGSCENWASEFAAITLVIPKRLAHNPPAVYEISPKSEPFSDSLLR